MAESKGASAPVPWAVAAIALALAAPWWAMGTDSPVANWWVWLTLGIWLLGLMTGVVCIALVTRYRSIGMAVLFGTLAGCVLFVTVYLAAFALGEWD